MELFAKIVNGFHPLAMIVKSSILDVLLDSEYASNHWGEGYFKVHISWRNAQEIVTGMETSETVIVFCNALINEIG